jgi:hypothetical protein
VPRDPETIKKVSIALTGRPSSKKMPSKNN